MGMKTNVTGISWRNVFMKFFFSLLPGIHQIENIPAADGK